jgi:hypothetical protein
MPKAAITLDDTRSQEPSQTEDDEPIQPATDSTPESTPENLDPETEKRCASLRSILNANVGACYVQLVSFGSKCHLGAMD